MVMSTADTPALHSVTVAVTQGPVDASALMFFDIDGAVSHVSMASGAAISPAASCSVTTSHIDVHNHQPPSFQSPGIPMAYNSHHAQQFFGPEPIVNGSRTQVQPHLIPSVSTNLPPSPDQHLDSYVKYCQQYSAEDLVVTLSDGNAHHESIYGVGVNLASELAQHDKLFPVVSQKTDEARPLDKPQHIASSDTSVQIPETVLPVKRKRSAASPAIKKKSISAASPENGGHAEAAKTKAKRRASSTTQIKEEQSPVTETTDSATVVSPTANLEQKSLPIHTKDSSKPANQAAAAAVAIATSKSTTASSSNTNSTAAPTKPKRKRTTRRRLTVHQKIAHNKIEKKYRTNINEKIFGLQDLMPPSFIAELSTKEFGDFTEDEMQQLADEEDCMLDGELERDADPNARPNKSSILERAAGYILYLKKANYSLRKEMDALMKEDDE